MINKYNLLLFVSIICAGLSIFFLIQNAPITGFATASNVTYGKVNLTVQTALLINFSIDSIEWGTGRLETGNNITLDTSKLLQTSSGDGRNKSLGGNFSGVWNFNRNRTEGLLIENVGNVNATIFIMTTLNASTFIGGGSGSYIEPEYQFNVTNNLSSSCWNSTGFNLGTYYTVNNTNSGTQGTRICSNMSYLNGQNRIKIDVRLVIPPDSKSGYLEDNFTATAIQSAT